MWSHKKRKNYKKFFMGITNKKEVFIWEIILKIYKTLRRRFQIKRLLRLYFSIYCLCIVGWFQIKRLNTIKDKMIICSTWNLIFWLRKYFKKLVNCCILSINYIFLMKSVGLEYSKLVKIMELKIKAGKYQNDVLIISWENMKFFLVYWPNLKCLKYICIQKKELRIKLIFMNDQLKICLIEWIGNKEAKPP